MLAIDPGPETSGYCWFDGSIRLIKAEANNILLLEAIRRDEFGPGVSFVFEKVQGYGRPVGAPVFETVFWTGRMFEAALTAIGVDQSSSVARIPFRDVKKHLCPGSKGKDADFKAALQARWGGKAAAMGTKKEPGPLSGVTSHGWSALALAVVWWDRSQPLRDAEKWAVENFHGETHAPSRF